MIKKTENEKPIDIHVDEIELKLVNEYFHDENQLNTIKSHIKKIIYIERTYFETEINIL
jgi:hypothetical protein